MNPRAAHQDADAEDIRPSFYDSLPFGRLLGGGEVRVVVVNDSTLIMGLDDYPSVEANSRRVRSVAVDRRRSSWFLRCTPEGTDQQQ